MYVLGYQAPSFKSAKVVKVETHEQATTYITNLPDDYCGIVIDIGVDSPSLRRMTGPMLVLFHNLFAEEPVKKFHDLAAGRVSLFRVVERIAKPAPPEMLVAPAAEVVQTDDAPSTTEEPADNPTDEQPTQTEEANMAAKKTAKKTKAKKAPKAPKAPKVPKEKKVKDGLPRAGSKKAELLRLLQRKTGATMDEMLKATGWKACLGTAKAVTESAKLKFRSERGTDGKPSRWYAE